MKYYRVTVKLKTGFQYSYTCIHRMLEGMMQSSQSYWTESVISEEINAEDFRKTREVTFEKEMKEKIVTKKVPEEKPVRKNKIPQMASLENFFEGTEPAPENKKWKKRV